MKKAGVIGGLGPASTADYYMGIVRGYRRRTRGAGYPELIIYSVDMDALVSDIDDDRWDAVAVKIAYAAEKLASAGADFAAIASNTPHLAFGKICARSPLPLVGIVRETCEHVRRAGYRRVLTIGTLATMRNGLYKKPLEELGAAPLTPSDSEQEEIYSLFFPNLENGVVIPGDRLKMLGLVNKIIAEQNADSVILGCTELPLMIKDGDLGAPVVNAAQIHIDSIVDRMFI